MFRVQTLVCPSAALRRRNHAEARTPNFRQNLVKLLLTRLSADGKSAMRLDDIYPAERSKTFNRHLPEIRRKNDVVGVLDNRAHLRRLAESGSARENAEKISSARRHVLESKISEFS